MQCPTACRGNFKISQSTLGSLLPILYLRRLKCMGYNAGSLLHRHMFSKRRAPRKKNCPCNRICGPFFRVRSEFRYEPMSSCRQKNGVTVTATVSWSRRRPMYTLHLCSKLRIQVCPGSVSAIMRSWISGFKKVSTVFFLRPAPSLPV